ncbi:DUF4407 domain-containing protein [Streptosporangium sp. NPDC002544]|uniref:DUF4407 domain-containing protein n=1 Tax=Streptosporangium sp. NPDC002544 TaxID=3154538 RepID=UPI00331B00EC
MAIDTADPVTGPIDIPPSGPGRGRGRGAGRILRAVVGVDEDLMDRVPEERPKYTRQGALVVATAAMAAVSMGYAVFDVFDAPWPVIASLALVWGVLIGILDSWLVISLNGVTGRGRRRLLLPRLLISAVVGVIIAEPLTIRVFEPTIVQRIGEDQQKADKDLLSAYLSCHSPAGAPGTVSIACENYRLPVAAPNDTGSLTTKQRELGRLETTIKRTEGIWTGKQRLARLECAGAGGSESGFSGLVGEGPRCARLTREAEDYERSSGIQQMYARRAALNEEIGRLTDTARDSGKDYDAAVVAAAEKEVARQQRNRPSRPDLLKKIETLNVLSAEKPAVLLGHIFLTLLFLLIDCSPVLTKLLSRPTMYDLRLAVLLSDRADAHDTQLRRTKRRRRNRDDLDAHRQDLVVRRGMADASREAGIEDAMREAQARKRLDDR